MNPKGIDGLPLKKRREMIKELLTENGFEFDKKKNAWTTKANTDLKVQIERWIRVTFDYYGDIETIVVPYSYYSLLGAMTRHELIQAGGTTKPRM